MTDRQDIFQDYLLGDRMGDLEESLKESIRVSCDQQTYPAAGTILWSDGREMAMDRGDCHTLVISGTGGGKTVNQVMPALRASIKVGESLFVTDVKGGELYEQAWPYLKQQGYRVLVVNLRHPLRGIRYNPLALPFQLLRLRKPELQALGHLLLMQAADTLLLERNEKQDPFWEQAARDTFLGLAYLLAESGHSEFYHLQAIYDLFALCQKAPKQLCAMVERVKERELGGAAWRLLQTRLFSSNSPRTEASIDSVLASKFNRLLGTPLQTDLLCGSDLDITSLDEEKVAIFLMMPDETEVWQTHASLLLTQVYQYLCLSASDRPDGQLPYTFHFLLEEFGNLDLGSSAAALFSAGRSRRIRVTAVIQNFSQLNHRYGVETADTIRFNCGNWIYLYTRDLETLQLLSDLCGTRTFLRDGVTRPVASVGDLQRIEQGKALVFQQRKRPYLTELAPIWDYPETAEKEEAQYPARSITQPIRLLSLDQLDIIPSISVEL